MGSGYYVAASQSPELSSMTEEEIADVIVCDITEGVGHTGIRSGIIGELGCSPPLDDNEAKVLRAASIAQRRTGATIVVHPPIGDDEVLKVLKILDDVDADLTRTVISHIDIFGYTPDTRRRLIQAGCYLEFDGFGFPGTAQEFKDRYLELPSDIQRINEIIQLVDEGYLNQILISQDHCFKHLLVKYGGYGYAHILRDLVPVMRSKGMSQEQVDAIMVENPKRVLTLASAEE
jgi:phosphotriesterase-related protein